MPEDPAVGGEVNEVVTLTTVCYMPVGDTTISGMSGDKYDKTYQTHKNELFIKTDSRQMFGYRSCYILCSINIQFT